MEKIMVNGEYTKKYVGDVQDTVEILKVKILNVIKHHVKCGYSNKRIVMTKQHSYHICCEYDAYVLYDAMELLNSEFEKHNIPIIVCENGKTLMDILGYAEFFYENGIDMEFDISITVNILR